MFCPQCGVALAEDASFCTNCGYVPNSQTVAPVQPSKPSKPSKVVVKKSPPVNFSVIAFGMVLVAIYACITVAFFLLLSMKETIGIESKYAEDVITSISFGEFLALLRNGNRIFLPTVVSTAFGVGLPVLYYLVPVFGLWASIGAMLKRNTTQLCVAASITIGITALLTVGTIPLTLWLVPGFKQAVALQGGVMLSDLGNVSFLWPAIIAAIAVVLMVVGIIVTNIYRKWRAKK